ICTAAILLDPVAAFFVGGVGAFLGDLLFYPAPMFVSLVTHGLQAVVISLCARHAFRSRPALGAGLGVTVGAIIMVVGYSLGRAYLYSTPEYALLKLPYQVLQAAVGAVVSMLLCWKGRLVEIFARMMGERA
ncbi:MAG TPA: ECF transporter S component, partial [Candidatus Aphodomonas merdavium]|nr:ECF transporter S component [Candidatus Aphodomonas merdavium]